VLSKGQLPDSARRSDRSAFFHAEALPECPLASRRKGDYAGILYALRPTELITSFQQRRAGGTGKMMAAHAPIETGAQQTPALRTQGFDVDSDLAEELLTGPGKGQPASVVSHVTTLLETIEGEYAELASKMVVANASLS